MENASRAMPQHVSFELLYISKEQSYSHWCKQSLWEAEPRAGSLKDWRGSEDLKLSLRKKNQIHLPGTQQLTHEQGLSVAPKQMPSMPMQQSKQNLGAMAVPSECK